MLGEGQLLAPARWRTAIKLPPACCLYPHFLLALSTTTIPSSATMRLAAFTILTMFTLSRAAPASDPLNIVVRDFLKSCLLLRSNNASSQATT
ncbi:hypothetical protein DFH09DRAFT_1377179 [Mycena vulgaris]|nr:hypothetical protein DFH09DRAFT_1377179 [Mycena vulgaris]